MKELRESLVVYPILFGAADHEECGAVLRYSFLPIWISRKDIIWKNIFVIQLNHREVDLAALTVCLIYMSKDIFFLGCGCSNCAQMSCPLEVLSSQFRVSEVGSFVSLSGWNIYLAKACVKLCNFYMPLISMFLHARGRKGLVVVL